MLLAVAWFIATWSWWWGARNLENTTTLENVQKLMTEKDFKADKINAYSVYAPLTVSIVRVNSRWNVSKARFQMAGFACLVLFAANIWFTYKETSWFRNRRVPQPAPTHTLS